MEVKKTYRKNGSKIYGAVILFVNKVNMSELEFFFSQADETCKCNGWKNPNPPPTPPRMDLQQTVVSLTEPCRSCSHTLGKAAPFFSL